MSWYTCHRQNFKLVQYLNVSSCHLSFLNYFTQCEKCEYTAERNETLKKHALTKHEGVRYSCDTCTRKTTDKVLLKQHIKSQHEGKWYPCKECK